jgi:hypothetical protein
MLFLMSWTKSFRIKFKTIRVALKKRPEGIYNYLIQQRLIEVQRYYEDPY